MDFDEYEYLEKTVEIAEVEKEKHRANGRDRSVMSEERGHNRSSKHKSGEKDDDDVDLHSKNSKSGDDSRHYERRKERGSSRHGLQSRDGEKEKDQHRSSGGSRDRKRDRDKDHEDKDRKRGRERDRDRDRDQERDRRDRGSESEQEHRSRSRPERHMSDLEDRDRETILDKDREINWDKDYRDRDRVRETRERVRESSVIYTYTGLMERLGQTNPKIPLTFGIRPSCSLVPSPKTVTLRVCEEPVDMVERSSDDLSGHYWTRCWNIESLVSKVSSTWSQFETVHYNHSLNAGWFVCALCCPVLVDSILRFNHINSDVLFQLNAIRSLTHSRSKEKKEEATEPEADPERDQRTVFAYQISLKADERDVYEFFSRAGKVRDVRLIMDRNSRRSKGVG
ncbi:unnamed protein product [Sphenostylis stenocarpa]|uniref:RRM domain-containing protein n=1 Tax=Sphenostylis stenocarpa TaxID=92480 RepID=A0AA86W3C4_9FABA|nr:unnamed protein product [Sphenostylis stenocarpa]